MRCSAFAAVAAVVVLFVGGACVVERQPLPLAGGDAPEDDICVDTWADTGFSGDENLSGAYFDAPPGGLWWGPRPPGALTVHDYFDDDVIMPLDIVALTPTTFAARVPLDAPIGSVWTITGTVQDLVVLAPEEAMPPLELDKLRLGAGTTEIIGVVQSFCGERPPPTPVRKVSFPVDRVPEDVEVLVDAWFLDEDADAADDADRVYDSLPLRSARRSLDTDAEGVPVTAVHVFLAPDAPFARVAVRLRDPATGIPGNTSTARLPD